MKDKELEDYGLVETDWYAYSVAFDDRPLTEELLAELGFKKKQYKSHKCHCGNGWIKPCSSWEYIPDRSFGENYSSIVTEVYEEGDSGIFTVYFGRVEYKKFGSVRMLIEVLKGDV